MQLGEAMASSMLRVEVAGAGGGTARPHASSTGLRADPSATAAATIGDRARLGTPCADTPLTTGAAAAVCCCATTAAAAGGRREGALGAGGAAAAASAAAACMAATPAGAATTFWRCAIAASNLPCMTCGSGGRRWGLRWGGETWHGRGGSGGTGRRLML